MKTFDQFVFFLTTAEDERGCFIGEGNRPSPPVITVGEPAVAAGVYRVEDGTLRRVEPPCNPAPPSQEIPGSIVSL
jgi:hypothetical protein